MTVERRFVASLADIRAVVCECVACGARLVLKPAEASVPDECPNDRCVQAWSNNKPGHVAGKTPLAAFVLALRLALQAAEDQPGYRVLLEFEEPPLRTAESN